MILYTVEKIKNTFSCTKYPTIKCTRSGLRQFLATESSLKMMKNAFYFTLKDLFVLKIFKFLSRRFVQENCSIKNLRICEDATWLTNNADTHIDQYLKK